MSSGSSGRARAPDESHDTGRSPRRKRKRPWVSSLIRTRAGHSGSHPPRNSVVAIDVTVIMFAYSAMKNPANFIELYSVWKPATSSLSASGKSNGTRFVSAKTATRKMRNEKTCGKGPRKTFHAGKKPP